MNKNIICIVYTVGQIESLFDVLFHYDINSLNIIIMGNKKRNVNSLLFFKKEYSLYFHKEYSIDIINFFKLIINIITLKRPVILLPRGYVKYFQNFVATYLFKEIIVIPDGAVPTSQLLECDKYFNNRKKENKIIFTYHRSEYLTDLNYDAQVIEATSLIIIKSYFKNMKMMRGSLLILGKTIKNEINNDKIWREIKKIIKEMKVEKVYYLRHPREVESLGEKMKLENIESYTEIQTLPEVVVSIGSSALVFFENSFRIYINIEDENKRYNREIRSNLVYDKVISI